MNRRDEATEVVGRFKVPSNAVSPALICRLRQIAPRFTDEFIRSVALPVIKGRPFSNRLIDWLCVNYSKVSSVRYGAKPGFFLAIVLSLSSFPSPPSFVSGTKWFTSLRTARGKRYGTCLIPTDSGATITAVKASTYFGDFNDVHLYWTEKTSKRRLRN